MSSPILENLLNKSLTLVAINIFQPCNKDILKENLKSEVNPDQIDNILTILIKEQRVICENNHFRLTRKGIDSIIPGKGRILRDLQRMEYLTQLSSKGGGI